MLKSDVPNIGARFEIVPLKEFCDLGLYNSYYYVAAPNVQLEQSASAKEEKTKLLDISSTSCAAGNALF